MVWGLLAVVIIVVLAGVLLVRRDRRVRRVHTSTGVDAFGVSQHGATPGTAAQYHADMAELHRAARGNGGYTGA